MSYRVGADIGGTFTDVVLLDDEKDRMWLAKTPSTPEDPSQGVLLGMAKAVQSAGINADAVAAILLGTTIATNAVLEEKGARCGLVVTAGFEHTLHLARGRTPGPLSGWIVMRKPEPLAAIEHTIGAHERVNARGEILSPLDESALADDLKRLCDEGQIEALSVCLINSYANPVHEQRIKEHFQTAFPDIPISLSSEILPEFREYERTLITVMNAYVQPTVRRYLSQITEKLTAAKYDATVNILRSDGGVMSVAAGQNSPVHTLISGPSGGVSGAAEIANHSGFPNVIAFDMGGTSTDVSITHDGKPRISRETEVASYKIKAPAVDVVSIGAGAGSIAHVPITGALRVGPQSAGAVPGPACYNAGGMEATVTDANIVLGYLPPSLLGGEVVLDPEAARRAVAKIAEKLSVDLHHAALGIRRIVNENMMGGIRKVSIERGYDPRDFALLAFGGAGPLHANDLAILTASFPAIIPTMPGVLSALGFLVSPIRNEFARTYIRTVDVLDMSEAQAILLDLENEATRWLNAEGVREDEHHIDYQLDLRYYRQGSELTIHLAPGKMSEGGIDLLVDEFQKLHQREYGFDLTSIVEVVNLRVVAQGRHRGINLPREKPDSRDVGDAIVDQQDLYFDGAWVSTPILERSRLHAGVRVLGPAIITQVDSTTLVLPRYEARVDPYRNLLIYPEE